MTAISKRQQNRIDKERRILAAALTVFSRHGYSGATMDAVAAGAGLSKPTLYQYFPAKQQLFTAMMSAQRDDMMLAMEQRADQSMPAQLHAFAWRYAETVMQPDFLSLARLIIGEVQRFPEIGATYQASGPDRVLAGMIEYLTQQRAAGRLAFDDAELAAQDLWGLILSAPRNKALYRPDDAPDAADLARYIHNGLRVFLRAYSTDVESDLKALADIVDHSA